MVDTPEYNEWIKMARKDIKSANILFDHDADLEAVCFHCQQAAEKYLKGYLICKTGELQEGHSLVKLCKKALTHDTHFSNYLKDMAFLNIFYIEMRYPALDPLMVSQEDAEECLRIVDRLTTTIDELLA